MAGVKGRSGSKPGSPPGPGRNHTSFKALEPAIKAPLAMLPQASELTTDATLHYCNWCRAWGWEAFTVTVWGDDYGAVEGAKPLTSYPVEGRSIKHKNGCPNK